MRSISSTAARSGCAGECLGERGLPVGGIDRRLRRRRRRGSRPRPWSPSSANCGGEARERAAMHALEALGQLERDGGCAIRRRRPRPWRRGCRRGGAAIRRTPAFRARLQRRERIGARAGFGRQEADEGEAVGRQAGNRQRREQRRGAGNGEHRQVRPRARRGPAESRDRRAAACRHRRSARRLAAAPRSARTPSIRARSLCSCSGVARRADAVVIEQASPSVRVSSQRTRSAAASVSRARSVMSREVADRGGDDIEAGGQRRRGEGGAGDEVAAACRLASLTPASA